MVRDDCDDGGGGGALRSSGRGGGGGGFGVVLFRLAVTTACALPVRCDVEVSVTDASSSNCGSDSAAGVSSEQAAVPAITSSISAASAACNLCCVGTHTFISQVACWILVRIKCLICAVSDGPSQGLRLVRDLGVTCSMEEDVWPALPDGGRHCLSDPIRERSHVGNASLCVSGHRAGEVDCAFLAERRELTRGWS